MSIGMLQAAIKLGASEEFADALSWIGVKNRPSLERAMMVTERLALAYWEDRGWIDESLEQIQTQVPFKLDPHLLMALHEMGVWVVVKRGGKGVPTRRAPGPLLLKHFASDGVDDPHKIDELKGVSPHESAAPAPPSHGGRHPSHGGRHPSHGGGGPSHGGQPSHSPSSTPSPTPSEEEDPAAVGAELVLIEPDAELFPDLTPKALKKAQEAWRDDLFDRFWATYPRKVDKSAAYKSFCKAIEEGLTEQMLVDGMRVALGNWRETERQFIPYPSTWLNNKRWLDERDAPRSAADFAARAAAKRAAQPVEARERGGSP